MSTWPVLKISVPVHPIFLRRNQGTLHTWPTHLYIHPLSGRSCRIPKYTNYRSESHKNLKFKRFLCARQKQYCIFCKNINLEKINKFRYVRNKILNKTHGSQRTTGELLLVMISETHLLLDVHIYIRRIEPRKKILRVPFMVIIPMFRLQNLRKFVQPIFQRAMRSRDTRYKFLGLK